jgi:hypothetical protein
MYVCAHQPRHGTHSHREPDGGVTEHWDCEPVCRATHGRLYEAETENLDTAEGDH